MNTAAVKVSALGDFSHVLPPLPSFQGCRSRRVEMLFHPGLVWDSGNSERWGVILLLSSTCMSVHPYSHSDWSAGSERVRNRGFELLSAGALSPAFDTDSFRSHFPAKLARSQSAHDQQLLKALMALLPHRLSSSRHTAEHLHHQPSCLQTSTGKQPIHRLS